ncbi:ABC transporter substrate-binding protein [Streptomyces sp. NPDC053541]|uniref:ABC transporter substrate-binding protein n=1 Tax=Streptomyces sp. NPDC053541 TaxID=3365709 RepID=UPI0037D00BFD
MIREESRSLAELHVDALAEGGTLTVYAGGDVPDQQDYTADGFRQAFPDIDINMIVDYSKYHDVRIDRQLDEGRLVPDVTHLQTSFDFDRWKALGVLEAYKPAGFEQVHDLFKDPDGHWCAIGVFAFSYMHGPGGGPATPEDLVDSRWKGQILSSHPGDDDATLFLYKTYADRYGWDWIKRLADQDIVFHRGTNSPGEAVDAGTKQIGLAGAETGGADTTTWVTPQGDHPFLAWGQRAAMFKNARHPAAARLYLNWLLTPEWQAAGQHGWGVRTDVTPTGEGIWDVPNAHTREFVDFMADRATVERWRQTMILYFGEVTGPPTPGWLGLSPSHHA